MVNVRKSAHASHMTLVAERLGDELCFSIEDDSVGFDLDASGALPGHHGLRVMRERADQIGARLTVESTRGQGTKIRVAVPV
jgi:signal transduction histidine kinase